MTLLAQTGSNVHCRITKKTKPWFYVNTMSTTSSSLSTVKPTKPSFHFVCRWSREIHISGFDPAVFD